MQIHNMGWWGGRPYVAEAPGVYLGGPGAVWPTPSFEDAYNDHVAARAHELGEALREGAEWAGLGLSWDAGTLTLSRHSGNVLRDGPVLSVRHAPLPFSRHDEGEVDGIVMVTMHLTLEPASGLLPGHPLASCFDQHAYPFGGEHTICPDAVIRTLVSALEREAEAHGLKTKKMGDPRQPLGWDDIVF